jgi:hypothetical protein
MHLLGDLFGSLGEVFGGVADLAGEHGADFALERGIESVVEDGDGTSTYDRYLAGQRRVLNVNDW